MKIRRHQGLVLAVLTPIALSIGLFQFSGIFESHSSYYYPDKNNQTNIRFKEVAEEIKISFQHKSEFTGRSGTPMKGYMDVVSGVAPSLAVVDINNDGFYDLYVTQSIIGGKNRLYLNKNGEFFEEASERFGLAELNETEFSQNPLFYDYDGDGDQDLILSRYGCHSLFEKKNSKFFEVKNPFDGYCSNARGLSVLDYNGDGILDLFVANYFPQMDMYKEYPPWVGIVPKGDDEFGGHNHLFRGTGKGFIKDENFQFPYKNHSFVGGVGDFNLDGTPDLFVGNDFTFDRMYLNRSGEFVEVTDQYIPKIRHGFAGMNSEIFDFNRDGYLDIYVTNIYGPPFSLFGNILWQGTGDGFKDVSDIKGVRRCGWSWGAKFVDFDNSGKEDLIVANGMARGSKVKSVRDGESFWFKLYQVSGTPKFLRKYLEWFKEGENINYFGYQRSCLFQEKGDGTYTDVAVPAGLEDFENSRALVTWDFDNDGKMDFVLGNIGGPLKVYKNQSENTGHWIGFSLQYENKKKTLPIGAKFRAYQNEKLVYFRELYPSNGHRGQNDPRFHLGLGMNKHLDRIEIIWPNGDEESFFEFEFDSYNRIIKGEGRPVAKSS